MAPIPIPRLTEGGWCGNYSVITRRGSRWRHEDEDRSDRKLSGGPHPQGPARAAAEAQLEAAKALPEAYLRSVFESEEAKAWPRRRVGDVAETRSGARPPRERLDFFQGSIPWVKTAELRDSVIMDTEEHISGSALGESSLPLLPPGTLLVAMYGQGQTRGRTGLLCVPATTNQACFAILPNPAAFEPTYLQFWFRFSYPRLREETQARGGSQPNLNGQLLRHQQVPLPPLSDQKRTATALAEQFAAASVAAAAIKAQLVAINDLSDALLRRAFSGERTSI